MIEHRLTVSRSARYFTAGTPGREVWFALHGYGQLAARFLRDLEPLAGDGRLLVAPEALSRFYVDHAERVVGASWMTREDRLAEIADYVSYLDAVYREVSGSGAAPGASVQVLGFSQGCATAARWIAQGRVRATRLILWGGEIPPDLGLEQDAVRDRLAAAGLTLVVGSADAYITAKVLARDTARLDAAGVPYRVVRYEGGHEIRAEVLRALAG